MSSRRQIVALLLCAMVASSCGAGALAGVERASQGPATVAPGTATTASQPTVWPTASPSPQQAAVSAPTAGLARLEPPSGAYFGISLDWGHDSVAGVTRRLGRTPSVWVTFAGFPLSAADLQALGTEVAQVRAARGMLVLTAEPWAGLQIVTPAAADLFAQQVAAISSEGGVPVFVRFAHEMNGSWYPWGQQPDAYVQAFRSVAAAIHARAPRAAMMWAPNYGGGYPFAGGKYAAKPSSPAYALVDTNHDGRLTGSDDPYSPYYPGDDAVDWVGMTLYHWGAHWPWGANTVPERTKFADQLTGRYDGQNGDERAVPDFYSTYAEGHHKPLAITETAALWRPAGGGPSELQVKEPWWDEVFSAATASRFPLIRMVNWFEQRKLESEVNDVVDWRLTANDALVAHVRATLPGWLRFTAPPAP